MLANPSGTTLRLTVSNVLMQANKPIKSLFYSIQYQKNQLVAKPVPYSSEETLFEEEFILQLGESEQIIFKLIGIALDKNEVDLGNVKYQLQLPQLFDQQSHLIELGEKTKLHVNV